MDAGAARALSRRGGGGRVGGGDGAVKLAYLVARYPAVSQTFVVGEVLGLRREGLQVETLAIRRSPPDEVLSRTDRDAFESTYTVLPLRPWHLVRGHARAFARAPVAYLATLRYALALGRLDLRAVLWQLFYFAEAMIVWDRCERRGIRHLHVHFPNVAADVAMLISRYGGGEWTYSMTLHGPTELSDVPGQKLAEKVRRSEFTICISHYTRSQVMNFVEREHWHKLPVIHCGVDTGRFSPSPDSRPKDARPTVLAVGRLDPRKGHALLVEALGRLARDGVDTRVVVIGEGPERPALERLARERGVSDRLSLPGAVGQDEIIAWFASADVFCMPSLAEGLPVVLMEAMACGLPVVAPRLMGIPELVEDGVSGTLVAPGHVDELAGALARQLADPKARRRMGAAGREKVLAEFEVGECARQVAERMNRG
jgi:colanic acid/amylovoran biosynthesis glycosyltransferase